LFCSIRIAASCGQLRAVIVVPRGDRIWSTDYSFVLVAVGRWLGRQLAGWGVN
jgi:hypothetical protein